MPTIIVMMNEGRSLDDKRTLTKNITNAVVESLGVKPEVVSIILQENKKENSARGGVLRIDQ